jgi:hypothetical protein
MESGVRVVTTTLEHEAPGWPPYPTCPNCHRRLNGFYLDDSGRCPLCEETFQLVEWQRLDHGYWAVQRNGRMIVIETQEVMQAVFALFDWVAS